MTSTRIARLLLALLSATALFAAAPVRANELQDARQLAKQGQTAQALEQVDHYLASHPKDAQARFLKGLLLTEQHKTKEAIKEFSDLTRDYPELPEPYNNLAVLYAGQGEYQKARAALEAAIRTHPSYATAQENLGDIYAKMASQAYDKALQLDRSNTGAQTKLALIKNIFTPNPDGLPPVKAEPAKQPAVATAEDTKVPTPKPAAPAKAAAPKPAETAPAKHEKPSAAKAQTEKAAKKETAEKKEAAHPAKKPGATEKAAVLRAVEAWAKAWSAKDVKAYLAAYAKDFKTPRGEKRSAWERTRKQRISAPKSIRVSVIDPKVSITGADRAVISFKQVYHSNTLKTLTTRKSMTMVKSGDKWLILEERVGR